MLVLYCRILVSIQLVSLTSREDSNFSIHNDTDEDFCVSIQLVSLTSRELALYHSQIPEDLGVVSIQLVSLTSREVITVAKLSPNGKFPFN
jgi:hypothetical protein